MDVLSPDNYSAEEVARLLQLEPLKPEGGFFRRAAESETRWPGTDRRAFSVIYFLVTPEGFSALHRLGTDETWCFHAGDSLESLRLAPDGSGQVVRLGVNLGARESPMNVVPAHTWQGTRLVSGGRWALGSCVVAPEFVWSDFVLAERSALLASHPQFSEMIMALTRELPRVDP